MGALLLASGAKGKRYALPNSEIMIHQPLGGAQGKSTDVEIYTRRLLRTRETLNAILSERTGKDLATIAADTEKDNFMSSAEALEYGLIDRVMEKR